MSLSSDVKKWAQKSRLRAEAVIKTSIQDLYSDMQKPRAKGGSMPVDTGFLRNNVGASLNTKPTSFDYDAVSPVLNRMKIGDSFYFAWGANYAPFMNNRYGFRDKPIQKWSNYVDAAAKKVKGR